MIVTAPELNVLQVSFNTALRIFMKSPTGDALKLVQQYSQMKKLRLVFSPKLRAGSCTISKTVFNPQRVSKDFASGVVDLMRRKVRPIQSFIYSFLIHGSYATQDFIPSWSDLDTMIILKDCVFDSVDNLIKVKKVFLKVGLLCYWIDPLAHHQLSFITEFDLNYYPQSFLPLPSYEYAALVLGQEQIQFNIRDDATEQTAIIDRFRKRFSAKVKNEAWSQNQYDWKNDVAHVFLWPSLFLQTRGIYVYKKASFARAPQVFKDINLWSIQEATAIMRKWKGPNLVKHLPPRLIMGLPYWLSRIVVAIARKPALSVRPRQSVTEIEKLTREFLRLYEYKT